MVIGIVEDVALTSWTVNIGGPYAGVLLASNAIRGRFDPIRDDARRIYDLGDVIRAEVVSFDRTRDPQLVTKYKGLGRLRGGLTLETNPNHIPRIIGKKGSMISMIKRLTDCKIIVGRNGRVWIKGEDKKSEE
jgi:exosome complex component RRP4